MLLLLLMMIIGRGGPLLLSRRVVLVIRCRIPASVYDIEMNAAGVPAITRDVIGADAADCGTFGHGGTPGLKTSGRGRNKNAANHRRAAACEKLGDESQ